MKTIYFILLIVSFPLIVTAQIGTVSFIDTSVQTAGVTKLESIDIDNDGHNEILTSTNGNSGRLGFYQNLTNNSFSAFNLIESYDFCRGFAVGDFNNDNWNDIVSIGGINQDAKIHLNNSSTFSPGVLLDTNISIQVNDVVVADFDLNNSDDIVIIGQHSIDFYRNNGSGIFTKEEILSTSTSPLILECLDLAARDMDNDGDMDLISGETAGLVVYINDGNAVFTPHYYSVNPEIFGLIHPIDIDNDGDYDVAGYNSAGEVKWFSNNGNAIMTFEATLPHIPDLISLSSIDYNNNGVEDLYTSYANNISIFENDTNHTFNNEITVYQDNSLLMGTVQPVDIDHQGALDFLWSGGTNSIAFHLNQSPLSISEVNATSNFFYPNPTTGLLNFTKPVKKLTLYNLLGQKHIEAYHVNEINLTNYPSGMYLLVLDDNVQFPQKIIKE